ncbi:MAG: beta-N-acetylhexosaminidase [Pirellulales bacterium]|nr:beta-N-acetylhexosaminidase [Pirellulales bacterium]
MIAGCRSFCCIFISAMVAGLIFFLTCFASPSIAAEGPALVPQPVEVKIESGEFTIGPATKVLYTKGDARLADAADYLAGRLSLAFGEKVAAGPSDAADAADAVPGAILMTTTGADPGLGEEGYTLVVRKNGVVIRAAKAAGAFYGGITLLQLAPPEAFRAPAIVEGKLGGRQTVATPRPADKPNVSKALPVEKLVVPCATIRDKPRFAWRGLLIDPARHFWTIDELKQYVDYLAIHKLNILQIHFTDNSNWTVEVRRYPNLTPEKALNAADPRREKNQTYYDLARHYYTQDELKSLVVFARKRFVTIVPEIEMPGHAGGLLRGCPECGCTVDLTGPDRGEICPGREETYEILRNILEEMLEIFPSQYIHIGADECTKKNWEKCAACRKRMKDEGLENVTGLHGYFVRRMADYLDKKGRTLVGWNEILESGTKPGAIGMCYRVNRKARRQIEMAAAHGQRLVMTPPAHCYFDYWQSPKTEDEPESFPDHRMVTLRQAYELQPLPDYVKRIDPNLVLGVQGTQWCEFMKSFPHVLYQTYPRACAMSEVAWSAEPAEGRDYAEFFHRLQTHLKRLDAAGINYRKPTEIDRPKK